MSSQLIAVLARICELQRSYSSRNTPEMQERGRLIRSVLPQEIWKNEGRLRDALGPFGSDLGIDASDGKGLKSEAPWVRVYAKSMSPAATNGFYVVVHFARDGSTVFVTFGCGSTVWKGGGLVAESDEELASRTGWARRVVEEQFGTLSPFNDEMSLGATASLPRTFEKATVGAKRLAVDSLDETEFYDLLVMAMERLREIYEAQRVGRDLRPAEAAERDLEMLARPARGRAGGQGFRLSAAERVAIERRAMEVAAKCLEDRGYSVIDRSKTASYDLEAVAESGTLKIEVKGTTGSTSDEIFMTANEVQLHRAERGRTGLIVVSNIRLSKSDGGVVALGGEAAVELGWDIDGWTLTPMAYKVSR